MSEYVLGMLLCNTTVFEELAADPGSGRAHGLAKAMLRRDAQGRLDATERQVNAMHKILAAHVGIEKAIERAKLRGFRCEP